MLAAVGVPARAGATTTEVTFASWNPPGVGTNLSVGTVDGIGATLSASIQMNAPEDEDLSGPQFNPPGTATTTMLNVSANSELSLTLDEATPEGTSLLVYFASWRIATYTLTATPGTGEWSVASGMDDYSLGGPGGNVLTPDSPLALVGGVLRFTGPIEGLVISTDANPLNFSSQLITIALERPVDPTPPDPTPPSPAPPGPNPPEPPGPAPAPVTPAAPRFTG